MSSATWKCKPTRPLLLPVGKYPIVQRETIGVLADFINNQHPPFFFFEFFILDTLSKKKTCVHCFTFRLRIVYEAIKRLHNEANPHRKYFHYKHDICSYIDKNWFSLCPEKKSTFKQQIIISNHRRFSLFVLILIFSRDYNVE